MASRRTKASWMRPSIVLKARATLPVSLRSRPDGTRRSRSPAAIASAVAAISSSGRAAWRASARPRPSVSARTPRPTPTSTSRSRMSVSRIGFREPATTMPPPLGGRATATRSAPARARPPEAGGALNGPTTTGGAAPASDDGGRYPATLARTEAGRAGATPPEGFSAGNCRQTAPPGVRNSTKSSGPAALRAANSSSGEPMGGPPLPGPRLPPSPSPGGMPWPTAWPAPVLVRPRLASVSCPSRRLRRMCSTERYVVVPKTTSPTNTRAASPVSRRRRSDTGQPRVLFCRLRSCGAFRAPGGIRSSSPCAALRGAAAPPWTSLGRRSA